MHHPITMVWYCIVCICLIFTYKQGQQNRSGRPGIYQAKIIAKKKIKPTITPFIVQACVIWNQPSLVLQCAFYHVFYSIIAT